MSGSSRKPSRKSVSCRDAIQDVREWSGGPPGRQLVIARPDVWEWWGGPPGCLGVIGRPSRMSGRGGVGPPGSPLMIEMKSRMSGSDRKPS